MTSPRTTEQLDELEAAARRLMAKLAAAPTARGFDTLRERQVLIAHLDSLLDAYNGYGVLDEPVPAVELDPAMATYLRLAETGNPATRQCGVCGRSRYVSTTGARVCIACDHVTGGSWESLGGV